MGVVQVIVVVKRSALKASAKAAGPQADLAAALMPGAPAGLGVVARLSRHFVLSPYSQEAALFEPRIAAARASRFYPNLGVMLGTVDSKGLTSLASDSEVEAVHPASILRLIKPVRMAAAAVPGAVTWGLNTLGIPGLWAKGLTGKGVLVGHLDTGVDGTHPALQGAIQEFAEFDSFGERVSGSPAAHDSDEHGTHTAGTIAGRRIGAQAIGVAPGAKLLSGLVIEGGNAVARILAGMDWVVGERAKVLSMSLGFPGYVEDFRSLTQVIRNAGILPVFAVGNEGPGTSRSPGNYPEALSVGACDASGHMADFSSSQQFKRKKDPRVPDVVAPGVDVISAKPGGGYQSMSGSSMATPHIAGLAALLFEAKPAATVDDVENAILGSCRLGTMPANRAGRGLPNAAAALALLTGKRPAGSNRA